MKRWATWSATGRGDAGIVCVQACQWRWQEAEQLTCLRRGFGRQGFLARRGGLGMTKRRGQDKQIPRAKSALGMTFRSAIYAAFEREMAAAG